MARIARVAWSALALNLAVVVWGAFVRASGSGAGCGAHWPLCNGEIVPHSPQVATLIELTHRLTSGLALIAVAWLAYLAFRQQPRMRAFRRAAAASMVLILTEAALGAGLVLFRLVADNESVARALFMSAHLVNTFLLLGALALAAHFASGGADVDLGSRSSATGAIGLSLVALVVAGASGAIAALGDTLYPAQGLAEAMARDFSSTSHLLIRLRVLHPVIAIVAGILSIGAARFAARARPGAADSRRILAIEILVGLQFAAGFLNVVLLAPVWMQLVHLILADLVWIAVVLNAATVLGVTGGARARAVMPVPEALRAGASGR
jgi:cytochrome c oxidase assembly protein subunit 15